MGRPGPARRRRPPHPSQPAVARARLPRPGHHAAPARGPRGRRPCRSGPGRRVARDPRCGSEHEPFSRRQRAYAPQPRRFLGRAQCRPSNRLARGADGGPKERRPVRPHRSALVGAVCTGPRRRPYAQRPGAGCAARAHWLAAPGAQPGTDRAAPVRHGPDAQRHRPGLCGRRGAPDAAAPWGGSRIGRRRRTGLPRAQPAGPGLDTGGGRPTGRTAAARGAAVRRPGGSHFVRPSQRL